MLWHWVPSDILQVTTSSKHGRHSLGRGIQLLGNQKQTATERHPMRRGTSDIGDATLLFWFPSREHQWLHLASPSGDRALPWVPTDRPLTVLVAMHIAVREFLSRALHATGGKTTDFPSVCVQTLHNMTVDATNRGLQRSHTRFHDPPTRASVCCVGTICPSVGQCGHWQLRRMLHERLSTRAVHIRSFANLVTSPSVTRQGPPRSC